MGYCPYWCIFCDDEEDNGWGMGTFSPEEAAEKTGKSVIFFNGVLDGDDRRALSVCSNCCSGPQGYKKNVDNSDDESDDESDDGSDDESDNDSNDSDYKYADMNDETLLEHYKRLLAEMESCGLEK